MVDNRSHKDRVLEIYNAEIAISQTNIAAKTQNISLSALFEKRIDDVLRWPFRKARENKIQKFLDFYQRSLPNYDTDFPQGNQELHGKELAEILLKLRVALKPEQQFNKDTWKGLKSQFKNYREKQEAPIKTMNEKVNELTTSIEYIHKCSDKDDEGLAVILKRDFEFHKEVSRKNCRETGYSDYFYVDIHKEIKNNIKFRGVKTSMGDRLNQAEKRIDELEKKKDDEVERYFINMVDANKITSENFKASDAIKKKILELCSNASAQVAGSQVNDSPSSLGQDLTADSITSVLFEQPNNPLGGTAMENEEKDKEKEKDILANKVTVGVGVASIGGAALLGAVTIGTGGLFLPIAVGVGTVVAGAIAISEQDRIGKETKQQKEGSEETFAEVIQKQVVDNPSKILTKPAIEFGDWITKNVLKSKEDQGKSQ